MSNLRIKNFLHRKKSFWLLRKWFNGKANFKFWKTIFGLNYSYHESKSSFYLLLPTLGQFIRTTIYVVFIIFTLELWNFVYPVDATFYKDIFDKQAIDTFLATIASISGVFLGLYFTAISSIAGNFLIRASQDIRRYFLLSPEGMQYVRTVALTGIIAVFYIVTKSFGHDIHPVGLGFLALLGAYVIIRFWSVGSNVFHALEPENSFPWISKKIYDSIRKVTPPGFQWHRDYIQNHQHKLAVYNIELLRNLIKFGMKEMKISEEQLVIALKYLGGLLYAYSEYKQRIPTKSFWFKRRNKFKDWLFASSTQIDLALKTGTGIAPEIIKDTTWFEEEILDISVIIFNELAKEESFGSILQGFESSVEIVGKYAKDFDVEALKMLFEKLNKSLSPLYLIQLSGHKSYKYKEQLAVAESQGRLAVAALLGLSKYLDENSADNLCERIDDIDWITSDGSIYYSGFPQAVISNFEDLSKKLTNEYLIEGKLISPNWYIKTLCIQQYLFALEKYFKYIKSLHKDYFTEKFDDLIAKKQLIMAVHLIQRWREFSNKYKRLVALLKKQVEDCNKFKGVQDLPWVSFNFDEERAEAFKREKDVENKLIGLLPSLKDISIGDDLPDYFGEALTIGVQACYDSCEDNDPERLKVILPNVFTSSLVAYDIAREKVKDWSQDESKIAFATEPLANLLDISGYARLYSELYQNQSLWNVMQAVWDAYLSSDNAKQIIELLVTVVRIRAGIFAIMPQGVLRAEWQIRFNSRMRDAGLPIWPDDRQIIGRRESIQHDSVLIRVVARWGGLMTLSGEDVFFTTYLVNHSAATGVEFPDNHDLRRQLERETEESNQDNQDE